MLQNTSGSPRAAETRARGEEVVATSDFVHYVVHFTAVREGRGCEMCSKSGDLRHTHYFDAAASEA